MRFHLFLFTVAAMAFRVHAQANLLLKAAFEFTSPNAVGACSDAEMEIFGEALGAVINQEIALHGFAVPDWHFLYALPTSRRLRGELDGQDGRELCSNCLPGSGGAYCNWCCGGPCRRLQETTETAEELAVRAANLQAGMKNKCQEATRYPATKMNGLCRGVLNSANCDVVVTVV